MMRYSLHLFLFLLLTAGKGFSQSLVSYEEHRPSVNSEQFNIGASIETALSKGQPSVTIPLLELQGKGYNLPISLVFYGGDVNCETEASTVGLGWSLMAGGCITSTVRDEEDTSITTASDAPWQFQGDYLESMFQTPAQGFVEDMNSDLMPDEIQYSIPGHQGTVEMVEDNQHRYCRKLFPDETYKLGETANGYVITADDGTRFIFEDMESKVSYGSNSTTVTSAWFLTRIETVKGGAFQFHYAGETMIDPHDEQELDWYGHHYTRRITSVVSDFGSVTFTSSGDRMDRSEHDMLGQPIPTPSERITRIELKDETGAVVKGYELYNDNYFTNNIEDTRARMGWSNYRLRLDSIRQYDASGNRLPPYAFSYSYRFHRAKTCYNQYYNNQYANARRGSWTSTPFFQAIVDLYVTGMPACILVDNDTPYEHVEGMSMVTDYYDGTVDDYFCLDSIRYPTGALDAFEYESHDYTRIAGKDIYPLVNLDVEGKRLRRKVSGDGSGNVQANTITEYIYRKHDSSYGLEGGSSGVLASPSFHNATRYTWGRLTNGDMGYVANRTSSNKPFNSYMGQPVYYREVEEITRNSSDSILKRHIHYFSDNLLEPPAHYVYMDYHNGAQSDRLTAIPNHIYGIRTGYEWHLNGYNTQNLAYLAYPVGEFCRQYQDGWLPRKEVVIDGNGRLMLKKEYTYGPIIDAVRYGYVYTKEDLTTENGSTPYLSFYNISRSSRHACRSHVRGITETAYSYRDGGCDSTVTETGYGYNLQRVAGIRTQRQDSKLQTFNCYPDDLDVPAGSSLSAEAQAVAALQRKNIIGKPLQTVRFHNGVPYEGHYNDFMLLPDSSVVPKASYGLSLNQSNVYYPYVSNGAIMKNSGFYLQEEALSYDADLNPCHVSSRTSPDKVYVWGYGGRFPVAVIENYTGQELNSNSQLQNLLSQLDGYRKINGQTACAALKSLNMNIRNSLPDGVLVRTYTYDPYAGLTSEFDCSGVGTIYTYDGFGRLDAMYDDRFNLLESYTYHYGH